MLCTCLVHGDIPCLSPFSFSIPNQPPLHPPHIVPQHVCVCSVEEPCRAPFLPQEARKGRRFDRALPSRLLDCKSIKLYHLFPSNGSLGCRNMLSGAAWTADKIPRFSTQQSLITHYRDGVVSPASATPRRLPPHWPNMLRRTASRVN